MHAYFDEKELANKIKIGFSHNKFTMKDICHVLDSGEFAVYDFLEGKPTFSADKLRSLQSFLKKNLSDEREVISSEKTTEIREKSLFEEARMLDRKNNNLRASIEDVGTIILIAIDDMQHQAGLIGHNQPPADDLKEEDNISETLNSLREEVDFLKNKIDELEQGKISSSVKNIQEHLQTFMDNFMPVAGKGTALMLVATTATMLARIGFDTDLVAQALLKFSGK